MVSANAIIASMLILGLGYCWAWDIVGPRILLGLNYILRKYTLILYSIAVPLPIALVK